jgi:hypothetical protein
MKVENGRMFFTVCGVSRVAEVDPELSLEQVV